MRQRKQVPSCLVIHHIDGSDGRNVNRVSCLLMCRKNQCYINTVQVLIVGFAIEASRRNYDKKEPLSGTILTLLFAERGDLLRAANLVCSTCGFLPAFLLRCVRYRGCPLLLLLLRLCAKKKKKKAKTVLKALVVSSALRNQPGGPIIPSYTLPGREPSRPFRESQGESLL